MIPTHSIEFESGDILKDYGAGAYKSLSVAVLNDFLYVEIEHESHTKYKLFNTKYIKEVTLKGKNE